MPARDFYAAPAYGAAQVMITATAYLWETAANIPVKPGGIFGHRAGRGSLVPT